MAMIEFLERLPLWLLAIVLNAWLMGSCSWVCGFSGATSFLFCKSTSNNAYYVAPLMQSSVLLYGLIAR